MVAGRLAGGDSTERASGHAPSAESAKIEPISAYSTAKMVEKMRRNVEILRARAVVNAMSAPVNATPISAPSMETPRIEVPPLMRLATRQKAAVAATRPLRKIIEFKLVAE